MLLLIFINFLLFSHGFSSTPSTPSGKIEIVSRLLYAKEADNREFPYFAYLKFCGAAIISDRWAVSAGHCFENLHHIKRKEIVVGNPGNDLIVTYDKVIIHPDYRTLHPYKIIINDIALIRFSKQLQFSATIQPVSLPTSAQISKDRNHIFIGRGYDENGQKPRNLMKVDIIRLTTDECLNHIPHIYRVIRPHLKNLEKITICTKRNLNLPAGCLGDSGSPMVQNNTLIGIASYIDNRDCTKSQLNFFTNVAYYVKWIKHVTEIK